VRIIRTCRDLGIKTVAVHSTADRESLHVRLADRGVCVGPPPASRSYHRINNLIQAAKNTRCEAVHPGAGPLSEDAGFARAVRAQGLIFIGPDPEMLELLGNKALAQKAAGDSGLPLVPGSGEPVRNLKSAKKAASELGFPVIVKAAAARDGRGMRIVRSPRELGKTLDLVKQEAEAVFSDGTVFIERYLESPRRVEFQIIADGKGKAEILEESGASGEAEGARKGLDRRGCSRAMRKRMSQGAVKFFRRLKYRGAGTIDFLVQGDEFFFLEAGPRLQPKFPVTGPLAGTELLRRQILSF
jgi:acetyl-CoA carboxylase biotin carboxylase subunit